MSLRLLAPAKINLHLRVAAADGSRFHPLSSWMCTVGLFDTLTIESGGKSGEVSLSCDDATLPCDETNLVVRTARAVMSELRAGSGASLRSAPGVRAHLSKA